MNSEISKMVYYTNGTGFQLITKRTLEQHPTGLYKMSNPKGSGGSGMTKGYWNKIGNNIPGRSGSACQSHYNDVLIPAAKTYIRDKAAFDRNTALIMNHSNQAIYNMVEPVEPLGWNAGLNMIKKAPASGSQNQQLLQNFGIDNRSRSRSHSGGRSRSRSSSRSRSRSRSRSQDQRDQRERGNGNEYGDNYCYNCLRGFDYPLRNFGKGRFCDECILMHLSSNKKKAIDTVVLFKIPIRHITACNSNMSTIQRTNAIWHLTSFESCETIGVVFEILLAPRQPNQFFSKTFECFTHIFSPHTNSVVGFAHLNFLISEMLSVTKQI